MCGRFTITHPNEALAALFGATPGNDLPPGPRHNICPTQPVAVVTSDGGMRRLQAMRWGFIPSWYKAPTDGPLIINARSDTVADKPAFREAVRARRCIVPASGFYEWTAGPDKTRLPYYITRADGAPMALAAIWQRWGDQVTCAVVSTEAGPGMAGIHDREPVILDPADWPLWLGEAGHGAARLMRPTPPRVLRMHRVGVEVNSNRATGAHLIAPVAA
ncbi:MAG: SOS response-associated peptidase [Paracoccaceae bacterium]